MHSLETHPDRHFKHNAVCEWFKTQPCGKVLDVPSGTGALSKRLVEMGFDVSSADIDPDRSDSSLPVAAVDLNKDLLPSANGALDYVACVDSLHRVAFIENAISEFSRVLRREGVLLITIPNYSALFRRVMFLFLGSLGRDINQPTFSQSKNGHTNTGAHFRQPLMLPQLLSTLQQYGFTNIQLHRQKTLFSSLLGYPFGLIIRAVGFFLPRKVREEFCLSQMSSGNVLLGSRFLLITASRA